MACLVKVNSLFRYFFGGILLSSEGVEVEFDSFSFASAICGLLGAAISIVVNAKVQRRLIVFCLFLFC